MAWSVKERSGTALVLEDRRGAFARIFALPFFLAGVFGLTMFVLSASRASTRSGEPGWPASALLLPLFVGGAFTLAGGWGCFGRSAVRIDGAASEVVEGMGLFVPRKRRAWPFAAFDRVAIEAPARRGGAKTAHWVFPVSMRGPGGAVVTIPMPDPDVAEALARELSEFLRLPVERARAGG